MKRGAPQTPQVLLVVENVSLARDHRLRKQAASLLRAGFGVTVICRRGEGGDAVPGAVVRDYPPPREPASKLGFVREYAYSLAAAAYLSFRTVLAEGVDLVQVAGTPDIYFTITWPLRLLGRRVVLDQRELTPELFTARYGESRLMSAVLGGFERRSVRSADHVITVNDTLRRTLIRRDGARAEAVSVVGNGPWLGRVTASRHDLALRRGRRFLCAYVGMMGAQDSVELAVRGISTVVHERGRRDCHFVFVGEGDARSSCEQLVDELRLGEFVEFTGWVDEATAFSYLATADLGIEPNMEDVVSPVKVLEYMAFGLPVVAFDLTETRALVGDSGVLVAPGDCRALGRAIDDLLDDSRLRDSMARAGRLRMTNGLAWDHQAATYVGVFRDLLSDTPRRLVTERQSS